MADETEAERKAARDRIGNEPISGRIEFDDGTVIEGGKVTKVGTRAIVENGKFLGMRPLDT